jgi:Arc/MetJ-type ribon-helix-helix transcriptional regulator
MIGPFHSRGKRMPTIQIEIPDQLLATIRNKVNGGEYDSVDEYFVEASQLMEAATNSKDEDEQYAEMRKVLNVGVQQLENGLGWPYSYAQLDADLKNRHEA